MHRRAFISLACGAATAVSAGSLLGLRGLLAPLAGLRTRPLFPGAELRITLDAATPADAELAATVSYAGERHEGPRQPARPGACHLLHAPYPFDDLVAGDYRVEVELRVGGRLLERHAAGGYTLRPVHFSA